MKDKLKNLLSRKFLCALIYCILGIYLYISGGELTAGEITLLERVAIVLVAYLGIEGTLDFKRLTASKTTGELVGNSIDLLTEALDFENEADKTDKITEVEEEETEKFMFPLNYVAVSVPFSASHLGVDFGWSSANGGSTPNIISVFEGTVSKAGFFEGGAGNMVEVYFDDELNDCRWYARYKHLSKINVAAGDTVEAGQILGKMGDTGDADGNHLHFDLVKVAKGAAYTQTDANRKNYSVNPLEYLYLHNKQSVGDVTGSKYTILKA